MTPRRDAALTGLARAVSFLTAAAYAVVGELSLLLADSARLCVPAVAGGRHRTGLRAALRSGGAWRHRARLVCRQPDGRPRRGGIAVACRHRRRRDGPGRARGLARDARRATAADVGRGWRCAALLRRRCAIGVSAQRQRRHRRPAHDRQVGCRRRHGELAHMVVRRRARRAHRHADRAGVDRPPARCLDQSPRHRGAAAAAGDRAARAGDRAGRALGGAAHAHRLRARWRRCCRSAYGRARRPDRRPAGDARPDRRRACIERRADAPCRRELVAACPEAASDRLGGTATARARARIRSCGARPAACRTIAFSIATTVPRGRCLKQRTK